MVFKKIKLWPLLFLRARQRPKIKLNTKILGASAMTCALQALIEGTGLEQIVKSLKMLKIRRKFELVTSKQL